MQIKFQKIHELSQTPKRAKDGDAGYDLTSIEQVKIPPLKRVAVKTGICIEIPKEAGCYGRIAPRSGLSLKKGIDVLGGVIDSNYRGELMVILLNTNEPVKNYKDPLYHLVGDPNSVTVSPGDRIAQLVFEKITHFDEWIETNILSESLRGLDGFGSTGQ